MSDHAEKRLTCTEAGHDFLPRLQMEEVFYRDLILFVSTSSFVLIRDEEHCLKLLWEDYRRSIDKAKRMLPNGCFLTVGERSIDRISVLSSQQDLPSLINTQ